MAGNGIELFLLSMSHNEEQEQPVEDLDTFVDKHRDSNHIPLRGCASIQADNSWMKDS